MPPFFDLHPYHRLKRARALGQHPGAAFLRDQLTPSFTRTHPPDHDRPPCSFDQHASTGATAMMPTLKTDHPAPALAKPMPLLVIAMAWVIVIGLLTRLLVVPFLPPLPATITPGEASDFVVSAILIPGVLHSLVASLLFLVVGLGMSWSSGRDQLRLLAGHTDRSSEIARSRGALRLGLGDRPLGSDGILAVFILLIIVYAFLIAYLQFRNVDDFFGAVFRAPTGWRFAAFLIFGLLAPIAEEAMFRGWLWTALRPFWPGFVCTLLTGLIWLLTHAVEGPIKLAVLTPVALLLGLARQQSASLRAPVLLHIALNLASLTAPFLLRLILPS